jgi:hypothetical protein
MANKHMKVCIVISRKLVSGKQTQPKAKYFASCKNKFIQNIMAPKLKYKYKLNKPIYNSLKHPKKFWKKIEKNHKSTRN